MHPSLRLAQHKPLIHFIGKRKWPTTPEPQHAHPAAPAQLKERFSDFLRKFESSVKQSSAGPAANGSNGSGNQVYEDFWEAPAWVWNPKIRHLEESEIDAIASGGASLDR
ncbi:hypothetical protein EWM64_g760 [Hericium alpestre]|uniref:Uncharacterized protein n=1 Tax=Hericium alpestre TaxID=135208 RepID=A0A4Z0AB79_9AGAM|nr:hypothetical protein EWM64_g760 [Hericium alpestre]